MSTSRGARENFLLWGTELGKQLPLWKARARGEERGRQQVDLRYKMEEGEKRPDDATIRVRNGTKRQVDLDQREAEKRIKQ